MSLFSIIKRNGKRSLDNNWGVAMLVMLVPAIAYFVLSGFIGFISFSLLRGSSIRLTLPNINDPNGFMVFLNTNMSDLITLGLIVFIYAAIILFVIAPLSMGTYYWNFQLVRGKPEPAGGMFYFFETFKRYRRAIWINVNIGIRKFLWSILFYIIPCGLCFAVTLLSLKVGSPLLLTTPSHYRLLLFMGYFLVFVAFIIVSILYTVWTNKYCIAKYLLCENDMTTVGGAIKASINYTKGYRFSVLWFNLSFIGWFILGSVLFPIALYIIPYYSAAIALFSLYIIETKRREQPVVVDKLTSVEESTNPEIVSSPIGVESGGALESLEDDLSTHLMSDNDTDEDGMFK